MQARYAGLMATATLGYTIAGVVTDRSANAGCLNDVYRSGVSARTLVTSA